jgi:hypothetical protein
MQTIFNVYSGDCYDILSTELENLLEGEIPLRQTPKLSCRKCYGRGYTGKDNIKHIYQPCPRCIENQLIDNGDKYLFFNYIAFKKK